MNQKQVHIEGKKAIKNKKRKILFGKPVVSVKLPGHGQVEQLFKKGKRLYFAKGIRSTIMKQKWVLNEDIWRFEKKKDFNFQTSTVFL